MKKKLIALFLMLSATFFVTAPSAYAGGIISDVLSGGLTAQISTLSSMVGVAVPGLVSGTKLTLGTPVSGIGGMVLQGGLLGDPFGFATALILCSNGTLCTNGQSSGVILTPVATSQTIGQACNFQIPMTFYNPNMDVDDTNRQVAIYRIVLPVGSPQAVLNDWFVNWIPQSAGLGYGWEDLPSSYTDENGTYANENYHLPRDAAYVDPLVTVAYNNLCSGNVCRFTDVTAPNNSYVAYVAKILGGYTYPDPTNGVYSSAFGVVLWSPSDGFVSAPNKFLNKDNGSGAYFPGDNGMTLGNAIIGPFQTGTPVCPPTVKVTISNNSVVTNATTPYTITATASATGGAAAVTDAFAIVNYQNGDGSLKWMGLNRGLIGWWSNPAAPYWASGTYSTPISCSGDGGAAATNNGYGHEYINLLSCSSSIVNGARVVSYVVTFNTNFTSPLNGNTLSGLAVDSSSQNSGWLVQPGGFSIVPTVCGNGALDFPNCTCAPPYLEWNGSSCVCARGQNNPPSCTTCTAPKVQQAGVCVTTGVVASGTFSASPTSVVSGGRSTLTWSSSNATICNAGSSPWSPGMYPLAGSGLTDPITSATTFTYQCFGPGGNSPVYSATVTVGAQTCVNGANNYPDCNLCTLPLMWDVGNRSCIACGNGGCTNGVCNNGANNPPLCTTFPAPTGVTLRANPDTIDGGQSSTLTWSSTNATSCTGSGFNTGNATSGSVSTGALSLSTNYAVICSNSAGSTQAPAGVVVLQPDISISANQTRISTGSSVNITWTATQITTCSITRNGAAWKAGLTSGLGTGTGTFADSPLTQTTYKLTCQTNGNPISDSVTVNVAANFTEF